MAQAKAKSNSTLTTEWTGNVLEIRVIGAGPVMFDRTKASADNRDYAERHGWVQRLCDRAAIQAPVRKPGMAEAVWLGMLAAHKQAKYEAIAKLAEYYEQGDVPWKMAGAGQAESGLLFTALCELRSNKSGDEIRKFLDSRTAAQLGVIRKIPELIEIMNRLRMERAGDVDMSEVLGDLDDIGSEEDLDNEIAELIK